MADTACDMKGFLSFLILWMVSKQPMTGAAIAEELEKRKGNKPSPGTIYPALKDLKEKGLLQANTKKEYTLTTKGKKELDKGLKTFCTIFSDFQEMQSCCKR
jgi:PadR family transcriptional regulator, regulatory protein PadR